MKQNYFFLKLIIISLIISINLSGTVRPREISTSQDDISREYLQALDSWEIGDYSRARRQIRDVRKRYPGHLDSFELELKLVSELNPVEDIKNELPDFLSEEDQARQVKILIDVFEPSPEQIIELIDWAFSRGINSSQLRVKYIKVLKELQRWKKALKAGRKGIELYPAEYELYLVTGRAAFKNRKLEFAQEVLESYVDAFPGKADGYNALARVYLEQGRRGLARENFSRYQAIEPGGQDWQNFIN